MYLAIIVFIILSLVNVILQTLKSILTIKSTRFVASLMNALAFGFYTIVIKQLTNFDVFTTVTVTIVANLVGVYFSIFLLDKFKKDQLWKITVTTLTTFENKMIKKRLENSNIAYTELFISDGKSVIDIYCYTQSETQIVKEVLNFSKSKYHYVPVNTL